MAARALRKLRQEKAEPVFLAMFAHPFCRSGGAQTTVMYPPGQNCSVCGQICGQNASRCKLVTFYRTKAVGVFHFQLAA